MISRSLALGLLVASCLTAVAGGSYLAVRQNAADEVVTPPPASPARPAAVKESEVIITPAKPEEKVETAAPAAKVPVPTPAPPPVTRPRLTPRQAPVNKPVPARAAAQPVEPERTPVVPAAPAPIPAPVEQIPAPAVERVAAADPEPAPAPVRAPEPTIEEIVIPSTSVIGLELETTVTSERARVEDRVDARVTRDVYAGGRLAIPAGSRMIGAVTQVERGGKVKERARLGIRFHTLVLAGGRQIDLRTEPIYREGESPANDSSRKIGGGAIGGAVLGAILGGGKGAIAGATAGAAGGTAVVMAGDRKAATLSSGSVVTVKLSGPVTLHVERQ